MCLEDELMLQSTVVTGYIIKVRNQSMNAAKPLVNLKSMSSNNQSDALVCKLVPKLRFNIPRPCPCIKTFVTDNY